MAFEIENPSKKKSLLFGIVTYKEKYWECDAYISLLESFKNDNKEDEDLFIFIVDNTDIEHWNIEKKISDKNVYIKYVNLKNPGISVAYNKIIDYASLEDFKWVVFLDQDTKLPLESYHEYKKKSLENSVKVPIKIPLIYSNYELMSPSIYKNYRSYKLGTINSKLLSLDNLSCINSGLMINSAFFIKIGGYNTKLKLDFCDHDFIEKVKTKTNCIEVLNFKLVQNFSADTHTKEQAINRYKIFCKDLIAFYHKRSKLKVFLYVDLPHLLKLTYKHKSLEFLKIRLF